MPREQWDAGDARYPSWEFTQTIISAFYETYNILGFGFLESVYRNSLLHELRERGLQVRPEFPIEVYYKETKVGSFRLDMFVEDRVAVEVKATSVLGPTDKRQLVNYLRASALDVGLLLHYGPDPKFHRIVSPRITEASRATNANPSPATRSSTA